MRFFTFFIFITLSFISHSVIAGRNDTVQIQLLLDARDVDNLNHSAGLNQLRPEHRTHRHISVLKIPDPNDVISENFGDFVEYVGSIVAAHKLATEQQRKPFSFTGKGINRYGSLRGGKVFWCLDSDHTKNQHLIQVAALLKGNVEEWLKNKGTISTPNQLKTPDEVVAGISKKAAQDSASFASISPGFPHISLAKGYDFGEYFRPHQQRTYELFFRGVNFVYHFGNPQPQCSLPEIYLSYNLTNRGVNFSSQLGELARFNRGYRNIRDLFNERSGIVKNISRGLLMRLSEASLRLQDLTQRYH